MEEVRFTPSKYIRRIVSLVRRSVRWILSCGRIILLRVSNRDLVIPFTVALGRGVVINVTDGGHLQIGNNASVGAFTRIIVRAGHCTIDQNVELGQGCVIACQEKVEIGEGSLLAEYVTVRDQDHVWRERGCKDRKEFVTAPVSIGKSVWVGAKGSVLMGSKMGDHSTLGAHGLLKGNIPANQLAVGVPAKIVEKKVI